MGRIISPSLGSSRLSRRHGQRIGFAPNSPYLFSGSGPAWSPASLSNLVQRFLDQSPTYHASTLQSFPILSPEETGTVVVPRGQRCALFDGVNDFGTLGARLTTGSVTALTVCAWIKGTGGNRWVAGEYTFSTANRSWAIASQTGSQRLFFVLSPNGSTEYNLTSASVVADGTWHHIAMTYSGSSQVVRMYIDGVDVTGTATAVGTVPTSLHNASAHYMVGAIDSTPAGFWNGSMRDVRVYNVAKSPSEIAAIFNQHLTPSTIDTAGLLAMYPMQAESGTIGYDVSGNGRHLTLTNITQSTFHAVDSGVNWNYNNWRGHTVANNLLTFSEQVDNAAWSKFNCTVSANAAIGPGGAMTADVVTSTGDAFLTPAGLGGLTVGAIYTYSIWLRSTTPRTISLFVANGNPSQQNVNVTATWTRFSYTFAATSSNMNIQIGGGGTIPSGTVIEFGGMQLELGSTATNYVPTGASAFSTGTIIPASLATSTQDAAGNSLGVAGPVAKPATVEVPCVTGDGGSVHCDLGSQPRPDVLSMWLFLANNGTAQAQVHYGYRDGLSQFMQIQTQPSGRQLLVVAQSSAGVNVSASYTAPADGWYFVSVAITYAASGSVALTVNGTLQSTATGDLSGTLTSARTILLGLATAPSPGSPSFYSPGRICDLRITTGGVTTFFPLQAGPGTRNTNRDLHFVRSNGTSGVVANAIVNGTVANIWANRCPFARDWCIENGGSYNPNILSFSNTFSNAIWNKENSSFSAGKLAETATNNFHALYHTDISGLTYPLVFSIKVKAAERTFVSLSLDSGDNNTRYATGTFDLTNGTITQQANTSTAVASWAIDPVDVDGYYRIRMVCSSIGNLSVNRVPRLTLNTTGTPTLGAFGIQYYLGNASNGVLVKEAQLETGLIATPYQDIATTPNGAFVPGRIGSNLDAAGNTKTLVAGKHGNPYSRINRNRWSAPELVNIGITSSDAVAPSTNVQAASVVDTQFARRKTDGSDRYFASRTALTGPDKTNAEAYTG